MWKNQLSRKERKRSSRFWFVSTITVLFGQGGTSNRLGFNGAEVPARVTWALRCALSASGNNENIAKNNQKLVKYVN